MVMTLATQAVLGDEAAKDVVASFLMIERTEEQREADRIAVERFVERTRGAATA
jgi:hypothetical protein